jgi:hypothetical protein
MTAVSVNTITFTVTHLAGNIVRSLTDIVRGCGLDPDAMDGRSVDLALRTWIASRQLRTVTLEIYRRGSADLVGRFDIDIDYAYGSDDDGSLWLDTTQVRFAIAKAGLSPAGCDFRILMDVESGHPPVPGWSSTTYLATTGFTRHAVGAAIGGGAIAASVSYYRRS